VASPYRDETLNPKPIVALPYRTGLPLCVTIALSSGCSSMVKENVLMRKIAAVETLGRAVHVDPVKPALKAPGPKRLELIYDGPLSNFAFKIKLRHYSWAPRPSSAPTRPARSRRAR
jgi:hypothetical protein